MKSALLTLFAASLIAVAAAEPKNQNPSYEKFYGKITAVNPSSKSITVHNKKRKTNAVFAWTENTQFLSNKQQIAPASLKEGAYSIVSYKEVGGIKEAQKVVVRAPKAAQ